MVVRISPLTRTHIEIILVKERKPMLSDFGLLRGCWGKRQTYLIIFSYVWPYKTYSTYATFDCVTTDISTQVAFVSECTNNCSVKGYALPN